MKPRNHFGSFLFLAVSTVIGAQTLTARPWLEVESVHNGEGAFAYRVQVAQVPMIKTFEVSSFDGDFSNVLQGTAFPDNIYRFQSNASSWPMWNVTNASANWTPPFELKFALQSSFTNRREGKVMIVTRPTMLEVPPPPGVSNIYRVSIVGYAFFAALVPCPPEMAEDLPAHLVAKIPFQDPEIDELLMTNNTVAGIRFRTHGESTYVLEASRDFSFWSKVAYIHSLGGSTNWIAGFDLGTRGNFFRLSFLYDGIVSIDNLPPLDGIMRPAPMLAATVEIAPLLIPTVTLAKGALDVSLPSVVGKTYRVEVVGSGGSGGSVWSSLRSATSETLTVSIPLSQIPPSGKITASEVL